MRRWRKRRDQRRRQKQLYRETGDKGHELAAAQHGRAMRKLKGLVRQVKGSIQPGAPNWAGSKWIVVDEVDGFVARKGIKPTSGKRRLSFGNPFSDHFWLNLWSFARDYGTANNYVLATEIKRKLTGDPNAVHVDYGYFYIERYGYTYRVQLIAGTHGTGPHLHLGVRRVD